MSRFDAVVAVGGASTRRTPLLLVLVVVAAAALSAAPSVAAAAPFSAVPASATPSTVYRAPLVLLDDMSFDDAVGAPGTRWIVEFFADWCGHCKHLAQAYQNFAERIETLKHEHDGAAIPADAWYNVNVSAINVDRSPGLAVRFQVAGIPRVFVIDGDDVRVLNVQSPSGLAEPLESGSWKAQPVVSAGWLHPLGSLYVVRPGVLCRPT